MRRLHNLAFIALGVGNAKTLQTEYGQMEVALPRDRYGSFDPEEVKKRQTVLAEGLSDKIMLKKVKKYHGKLCQFRIKCITLHRETTLCGEIVGRA